MPNGNIPASDGQEFQVLERPRSRASGGELSSTDYAVLGMVWRDGPCTPYAVMAKLSKSPSTFYRKRASSTYRVVDRLLKLGLAEQVQGEAGPRGERQVRVTPAGIEALRRWLLPPIARVEVAHSTDLVRQRMNFLDALSPEEQIAFVEDALVRLAEVAREYSAAVANPDSVLFGLAAEGALYETRARIEWLKRVKEVLSDALVP